MLKITIGFFIGIVLLLQLQELPSLWLLPGLFSCLIFIRFQWFPILGFIILGFIWAWFRADLILSKELHPELEGQLIEVTGVVDSLPQHTQFGERFKLLLQQRIFFQDQLYSAPKRIQLNWNQYEQLIKPGQQLTCLVKLKRPYGFFNLGTFDYEFYLFHQAIRATGYVHTKQGCEIKVNKQTVSVDQFRYSLKQSIVEKFSEDNTIKSLIIALMIGDKSLITQQQWQVLQRTGTSHLLAISGLHIGLVFGLGFYIASYLFRLMPFVIKVIPAQRIALLVGLFFALFYSALAGFALPTQRAIIMLCISVLSIWLYNPISISKLLATSLFLILLFDPFAIYTPSFWLSFGAVSLILYGMSYRVRTYQFWWTWGRAQWLIVVGLMPVVIFWFQTVAEFSFLANTIAIPLVSICVVPLILLSAVVDLLFPGLSLTVLSIVEFAMNILWSFLEFVSALPKLNITFTTPDFLVLIISVIAILWFLLPQGFPAKSLSFVLISPLFFSTPQRPANEEVWLHVLDVGQGTAVLIQTTNQTVLYDTGAKFSDKFNAGSAVVLPVLHSLGITKIDKIVVSHADNDHIGGLASIVQGIRVDDIYFNGELNRKEKDLWQQHNCTADQSWQSDGIEFTVLHPVESSILNGLDKNQSSCVLQIRTSKQTILLPGDIDYKIEWGLLEQYSSNLQSDILLVPHHGSKTSSSEPFIDLVKPKYSVITSGYRNRFGFPKQVIINRYQKRGGQILNTAETGMLTFRLAGNDLELTQYRAEQRRFWHTIP